MSEARAPVFSVVIPTYNRAGLLAETLASLWQQRFTDFDVIVVDDGSSDDTAALLRAHEPRLRWYRQDHLGPGAARNLGAQHARGEYLAFLDSDDLWFPWTLEVYARAIAEASRPSLMIGSSADFTAAKDFAGVVETPLSVSTFTDYFAADDAWRCWGAGYSVIRRDVFAAAGGFSDRLPVSEDADLVMRLGTAPGCAHVTSPRTLGYRIHPDSAMANLDQTLSGARHLLDTELAGGYPGGDRRAPARRQILSRHLRSVMLAALRKGRHHDAWRMYAATFGWHVRLGRWRFLLVFPFMAARPVHRA
jgi:glycosyltransferase involved in cell wall biosynthesis